MIKWYLLKFRNFIHLKSSLQEWKSSHRLEILQSKYLTKNSFQNIRRTPINHLKKADEWTKSKIGKWFEDNMQIANKHKKMCSPSIVIKKVLIKNAITIVRYCYNPTWAKKSNYITCPWEYGAIETLITADGSVNWYNCFENSSIYSMYTYETTDMQTKVHDSFLHKSPKL